jgi:HK97 gp10 family phage protein
MPDRVTLKIDGLDTIEAAIKTLPRKVQNVVLGQALAAGAEVIRAGVAEKIHSRTGKTADDLHVRVHVIEDGIAGGATVGAHRDKKTGRDFIMHFLEFGTKPHAEPKKKKGRKVTIIFGGQRKTKRFAPDALPKIAFGGKVYSRVKHPGTHAQAPMRRTVAEQGIPAVNAFSRKAWDGIRTHMEVATR